MGTQRVGGAWLSVLVLLLAAGRAAGNESMDFTIAPQEEAAYQAVKAIRPLDPLGRVRELEVKFLDTYPDSRWRRDARLRLLKSCVANDSPQEAVDECMGMTLTLPGGYLGNLRTNEGWSELGAMLAKSGRHADAARVRVLAFVRFPQQLENRSGLLEAMKEYAKAGQHAQALATARLALSFVSEEECKEAIGLVKASLAEAEGEGRGGGLRSILAAREHGG